MTYTAVITNDGQEDRPSALAWEASLFAPEEMGAELVESDYGRSAFDALANLVDTLKSADADEWLGVNS